MHHSPILQFLIIPPHQQLTQLTSPIQLIPRTIPGTTVQQPVVILFEQKIRFFLQQPVFDIGTHLRFVRGGRGRVGFEIAVPNSGGRVGPVAVPALIGRRAGVGGACSVSYDRRDVEELRSDAAAGGRGVGFVLQGRDGSLLHLLGRAAVGMIFGVARVYIIFLGCKDAIVVDYKQG